MLISLLLCLCKWLYLPTPTPIPTEVMTFFLFLFFSLLLVGFFPENEDLFFLGEDFFWGVGGGGGLSAQNFSVPLRKPEAPPPPPSAPLLEIS